MAKKDRSDWPVRKFNSHEEADAADEAELRNTTPAQRFLMVDLISRTAYALLTEARTQRRLPRHAWPVAKVWR
ncbi:MAG: hypothetical protein GC164_12570 [Phycisphaera sp.]|nr:hypothetical protein [Phycisphaera sp.]